jgi:hypothetical protein
MGDDLIPVFPDDFLPLKEAKSSKSFRRYILRYDVAVEWLSKSKKPIRVKSQVNWKKYIKHDNFPAFLPCAPHVKYKDKGWTTWGHFLGTNNVHPPTVYKNMTPEIISEKKRMLCEIIDAREDCEFGLISEYFKTGNSEHMFLFFIKNKNKILSIVASMIKSYNLPFLSGDNMKCCFDDGFYSILTCLNDGRFLPEKLGNRRGKLESWMATFVYFEARNNIFERGKKKTRINNINDKYIEEVHTQEYEY